MNKSLANIGGKLSRTKMKSIVAGRPIDPARCPYSCFCSGGAIPLDGGGDGNTCSGPVCYCPDGSAIYGANCPCL